MIRVCNACNGRRSCTVCGQPVTGFDHVGVRASSVSKLRSGVWHIASPCGHAQRFDTPVKSGQGKQLAVYGGGPLWKSGYRWQSIYWGTYWKETPAITTAQVDKAVADIEADSSYWGGLSEYNVGRGTTNASVIIDTDPPATIDDSQIGPQISAWIRSGVIPELGTQGAYNIFFPPGVTVTLQGSASCSQFCVPPNEVLLGDNKEMAEYEVGDKVVGMSGLLQVNKVYERDYQGDLMEIKGTGLLPIRITPEHPLLVVHGETKYINRRPRIVFSKPMWKQAKEIVEKHSMLDGDYLVLPKLAGSVDETIFSLVEYFSPIHNRLLFARNHGIPTEFILSEATAYLLGLYVAEGYPTKKDLHFVLHEDEIVLRDRIARIVHSIGYSSFVTKQPGEKSIRVSVNSAILAKFISRYCGRGATKKRIPDFILYNKDLRILKSFLIGYMDGDGHEHIKKGKYKHVISNTSSKVLIQQLQLAFARVGIFMSVGKYRSAGKSKIQGREVELHDAWQGHFYPEPHGNRLKRLQGDLFYLPVRSVRRISYSGKVYNIGTSDHTYLISNAVVHNCDFHDYDGTHFYTVEPYPCSNGCNQCTSNDFDTLTQGLSEEMVELATDMNPGTGWVIGSEEICDHCDVSFICRQITEGQYVNAWYSDAKGGCWAPSP